MSSVHAPGTHVGRPHINLWLVAVVALAAALVALGTWVLIDQTRSSSTQGLASSEITTMLDAWLAAENRYDAKAMAAFFTKDAVIEEHDPMVPDGVLVTEGRDQIFQRFQVGANYFRAQGWRVESGSGRIQLGDYVVSTELFGVPGEEPVGQVVVVETLDEKGKIAHQWGIVDWLQTP